MDTLHKIEEFRTRFRERSEKIHSMLDSLQETLSSVEADMQNIEKSFDTFFKTIENEGRRNEENKA